MYMNDRNIHRIFKGRLEMYDMSLVTLKVAETCQRCILPAGVCFQYHGYLYPHERNGKNSMMFVAAKPYP